MPPQPLTSAFPDQPPVRFQIPDDAMRARSDLAVLVARQINIWAYTDHSLAQLATKFLKADFLPVTAMLQALTGEVGRRAAIDAAARVALSADDLKLFTAVMKAIRASRSRRNEFAHNLWGIIPDNRNVLLLMDPKYLAQFDAASRTWEQEANYQIGASKPQSSPEIDYSKIFVYQRADLEFEAGQANQAHSLVFRLNFALSSGHPGADHMRSQLLQEPVIQQALESL